MRASKIGDHFGFSRYNAMRSFSTKYADVLIRRFGHPMPLCPKCNSKTVMSCREIHPAEPQGFTFECRDCRSVVIQWNLGIAVRESKRREPGSFPTCIKWRCGDKMMRVMLYEAAQCMLHSRNGPGLRPGPCRSPGAAE